MIYIPSYKRPSAVMTHKFLPEGSYKIVVPQSQYLAYAQYHAEENLMMIPDGRDGCMSRKRNTILDHAKNTGERLCIMLDDDIEYIGYFEKGASKTIDGESLMSHIEEWASIAEEMGTVLFGLNLQSDPKFYREYSPYSLLSPVLGPFFCVIMEGNYLRFDERLGFNEDYDYCLQVLQKHHKIFRNNKFHYRCLHLTNKGGCCAYRVLDEEKRQAEVMIKKWGSRVVSYDFTKSTNPRINCPLKGI